MHGGPLDDERLMAIERSLDAGDFELAQRQLAGLESAAALGAGTSYLVTRLLFARGRLSSDQVADRMRDLLQRCAPFPQATALLLRVTEPRPERVGHPGSEPPSSRRVGSSPPSSARGSAESSSPPSSAQPKPPVEFRLVAARTPPASSGSGSDAPPPRSDTVAVARTADTRAAAPNSSQLAAKLEVQAAVRADPRAPSRSPESLPPSSRKALRDSAAAPPSSRPPGASEESRYSERSEPRTQTGLRAPGAAHTPPLGSKRLDLDSVRHFINAGQPQRALDLVGNSDSNCPVSALLRARALILLDRHEEAIEELAKIAQAPLLEPEQRAECAELLIALGRLEPALRQAERAHQHDPHSIATRVSLAEARTRLARRTGTSAGIEQACELLRGIRAHQSSSPARVYALRAYIQATIGDPERVVGLAQRALSLDPRAVDALAAVALVSARLGRAHDAEQAWVRLNGVDAREAETLAPELQKHGIDLEHLEASERRSTLDVRELWDEVELSLLDGDREPAIAHFESHSARTITELGSINPDYTFAELATNAARLMTAAPVWRHFAPYDFSLWSLPRLQAALDLLYPTGVGARDLSASALLLGAYWGETLRRAHEGEWTGHVLRPTLAFVAGSFGTVVPCERMIERLQRGLALGFQGAPEFAPDDPQLEAWSRHERLDAAPPAPWDPKRWPDPEDIARLGRALERSVVGAHCEQMSFAPLDGSLTSLGALDSYLALIAPVRAPHEENASWCRRVAVIVGAYLGEVLRCSLGGRWVDQPAGRELGERSYRVRFGAGHEIAPVSHVLSRVCGRTAMSLVEFAQKTARKVDQER